MKLEDKTLRLGAAVILCAIVFRLLSGSLGNKLLQAVTSPDVAAMLFYMETGRVLLPGQPQQPPVTEAPTTEEALPPDIPQQPQLPQLPEPALPVFAPEDAALVEVNSVCGYEANVEKLLRQPLTWDLTVDAPTVLILHSHATESYTKTENYQESSDYRTLDAQYNMVSVGDVLAAELETMGITVIHDRTLLDYPSYSDSYNRSREVVRKHLQENPSICLVLDLHRDAMADSKGNQIGYTVDTQQGTAAQVMMVVGTDAGGLNHPNWEENMALAVKLHACLEQQYPGICRPISFRSQRFNQDLSAGALLIEIGAAGNTRPEALICAKLLAQCIAQLAKGTATADSTN